MCCLDGITLNPAESRKWGDCRPALLAFQMLGLLSVSRHWLRHRFLCKILFYVNYVSSRRQKRSAQLSVYSLVMVQYNFVHEADYIHRWFHLFPLLPDLAFCQWKLTTLWSVMFIIGMFFVYRFCQEKSIVNFTEVIWWRHKCVFKGVFFFFDKLIIMFSVLQRKHKGN